MKVNLKDACFTGSSVRYPSHFSSHDAVSKRAAGLQLLQRHIIYCYVQIRLRCERLCIASPSMLLRCADGLQGSKIFELACAYRSNTSTNVPLARVTLTPHMRPARQTHEKYSLQEAARKHWQLLQSVMNFVSLARRAFLVRICKQLTHVCSRPQADIERFVP
jgi:hypothetical protein